jgi:hypothetical protein
LAKRPSLNNQWSLIAVLPCQTVSVNQVPCVHTLLESLVNQVPCVHTLLESLVNQEPEPAAERLFEPDFAGIYRAQHCTNHAKHRAKWSNVTKWYATTIEN